MRWGAGALRWVRPLHSILCILTRETGTEIVPFEIDGIAAGNLTRGHRFHAPEPFAVTSFDDYRAKLARAFVILDPAERAAKIAHDATQPPSPAASTSSTTPRSSPRTPASPNGR